MTLQKHKKSLDSFIYNVTLHMVPQMLQPVPSSKTVYILQDYSTYLLHRLYHTPWLYKKFHKAHHKYVQPTAFSVTAIHPFEIVHTQLMAYCMPLFVFPTHWSKWLKRIRILLVLEKNSSNRSLKILKVTYVNMYEHYCIRRCLKSSSDQE